ncbi:inner centromere protein A [Lingula anatina]|uniref:Inner centromere protein A n=1 Tax=Lingula anatina TaxID=7574 RepID=A0A1S3IQ96_LINAN|nr:inner centromere protein A [Lingula anatina]|eukprot:XP_013400395.1 inner centromere protein A [Lingula anatina]
MVSIMAASAGRSGDGFNFHLTATQLIRQFANNAEDHFTWLEEILIEAKKAFKSPEVELLPKTPSAKRGRRRKKDDLSESDDNCKPPAKKASRATGKRKKTRKESVESVESSTSESIDMEPKEGSPVVEEETPPKRHVRPNTRSANTTGRTTRNSRNTRSNKDKVQEVVAPSPIMNMIDSVKAVEPTDDIKTPINDKENAEVGPGEPEDKLEVTELKAKNALKHVSPIKINTQAANSFQSPKFIKDFVAMKVKEKIHALEEFMRPGRGSPKQSATPVNDPQKSSDNMKTPVSKGSADTPQTPPTVVTKTLVKVKSRIGRTSDEAVKDTSNIQGEEKMETTIEVPEKMVPVSGDIQKEAVCVANLAVVEDTKKENEVLLKNRRSSITVLGVKSGLHRTSLTGKPGPRRSKSSRVSSSTQRSTRTKTIRKHIHKEEDNDSDDALVTESDLEDMVAKNENIPHQVTTAKSSPSAATPGSDRKVTRSKLRLKKPIKKDATSLASTPDKNQNPVRSTRTKVLSRHQTKCSSSDTESNGTPSKDAVFQVPTAPAPKARYSSTKDSPADRVRHLSNNRPIDRVQHIVQRSSPATSDSEGEVRRSTRTKQRQLHQQLHIAKPAVNSESSIVPATSKSEESESGRTTQSDSSSPPEVQQVKPNTPGSEQSKTPTVVSNTDYDASDDEATPVAQLEQPRRTTRTKTLRTRLSTQAQRKQPESSDEEAAHNEDAIPPQRTTRSKMRQNKPVPQVVCVSDADCENTPTNPQAPSSLTENAGRFTRSKMRKRPPASGSEDSDAVNPPEAKKMTREAMSSDEEARARTEEDTDKAMVQSETPCKTPGSDSDFHTPSSANNSDIVEKTPSPECPRNKVIRPHPASFLNALNQKKEALNSRGSVVTSFIQRNTPKKMTSKEIAEKKKAELEMKRQKDKDRLKKRDERINQKVEEQKRKREERMKKVQAIKEEKEKKEMELKRRLELKLHERQQLGDEVRDKAVRETKEKIRERQKKLQEAEERRKQEEAARLQKLQEQEEEAKRHDKMLERKKQYEEEERQRKIAESKKQQEERLAEIEKQRQEEVERLRLKKEEDDKLRERQREEREKELAREKAEREKAEFEKIKEKEKLEKERLEQEKEMEKQRLKEASKKDEEKRAKQEHSRHNQPHQNAPMKSKLNTTLESYDMTPPPAKRPYKLPDPDNYDINDLKSDESTDDEDQPRKRIPAWAQGAPLKAALINQHYHPPNMEDMFPVIEPPDLNAMFAKKKQRFNKRTSSAIWDSPLLKPGAF